jgi:hypothetical protein
MDELRESSLLFSLEGLMETERERVQREAREAQKRRAEELARVAEAAERRRVAAENERQASERRVALEREHERLEHERLEALKLLTVERARVEAESGLRLIEAEQARQHDLALAKLREAQRTGRYRQLAWLSAGALCASLLGGLGAYFGWIAPARARADQHLQSVVRESAERSKATELALAVEQSKNRALSERLQQQLACAPSPPSSSAAPPSPTKSLQGRRPSRTTKCGDTGDPLDDCLR